MKILCHILGHKFNVKLDCIDIHLSPLEGYTKTIYYCQRCGAVIEARVDWYDTPVMDDALDPEMADAIKDGIANGYTPQETYNRVRNENRS